MVSNDSSKYTKPTLKFCQIFFIFKGARPEKGLKISPFFKNLNSEIFFVGFGAGFF